MSTPRGLSRVSLPMLEDLRAVVEHGRLECPFQASDLRTAGFRGHLDDIADSLGALGRDGVLAALALVISERVHRPPPRLDLVWTGPESRASVARSTGLVVQELFESATTSVICGGYTFDRAHILEPLHRAMKDRGVSAMVFLDIKGATPNRADADAFARAFIDTWLKQVWTFGAPIPEIYYDPRTAVLNERGHDWATLHAKCVVVDDARALITSANFTDRGHTRNIEAGVLIDDPRFSEELAAHWRQLVGEGLVTKYRA